VQATAQQPQRAPDGAQVHYERHRPELTTLYRLVQQHAASFIEHTEASTGAELPRFIKDEFDAFLECGILAHGLLRLRCGECGHDKLLAFSCKRRGFCPSCGARRMSQSAAHLVATGTPAACSRRTSRYTVRSETPVRRASSAAASGRASSSASTSATMRSSGNADDDIEGARRWIARPGLNRGAAGRAACHARSAPHQRQRKTRQARVPALGNCHHAEDHAMLTACSTTPPTVPLEAPTSRLCCQVAESVLRHTTRQPAASGSTSQLSSVSLVGRVSTHERQVSGTESEDPSSAGHGQSLPVMTGNSPAG
jgi:hypothetical protein